MTHRNRLAPDAPRPVDVTRLALAALVSRHRQLALLRAGGFAIADLREKAP